LPAGRLARLGATPDVHHGLQEAAMIRKGLAGVSISVLFVLAFGHAPQTSAPIKLARHPDFHAGKVVFSYLGDIWMVNEDGSAPQRVSDHRGHDMYPRFSPDGKWIAFSSNRYGNNDVFVVAAAGGAPRRLTFHTGNDEVVGWSRDSQRVLFRAAHGDGAFPNVATLYEVPLNGGQEQPLPVDWGYYGSFSPDGKQLAFNRHPAVWTRQHYRGSYAADLWIVDLAGKTYTKLLPDERYNRYWPMWGADGAIYYVADPLPNDKSVMPGSAEVRKSANNIYKIPIGGGNPIQVTKHVDGNLFWPSMSSDGKVIVYEELFGIWKLDVASGRTSEIRIEIAADDKDNESDVETVKDEVDAFDLSPSGRRAAISARGQIFTIATERGDITRLAPDNMVSRNQFPKWSADGKYIAYMSDKSGRDEIWISDPEGRAEKDHRPRHREGRDRLDAGFEVAAVYGRGQETVRLRGLRREDKYDFVERHQPHRIGGGVSRQQVGSVRETGSHAAIARLYRAHCWRRGTSRLRRSPALLREQRNLDG
jgi:tricorn protease